MNYLAHLYLSGDDPMIMIGNFIADHVKGKQFDLYSAEIKNGILLHRRIDEFTDQHPIVEQSKLLLRSYFHKYAPVIVDVFYDHFLARDWKEYHNQSLENYSNHVYDLMENHIELLPERARYMLTYMKKYNWLHGYATVNGMENALTGLSRRTKFPSKMEEAPEFLVQHYQLFEKHFKLFFEELQSEVVQVKSFLSIE